MDVQLLSGVILELQRLRRRDHWTRQQLEVHQAKSLRHLRDYAYARSPFYQRFHEGLTDRSLQELPVLTKAMLMEQFDELVTDRAIRLEEVEAHRANLRGDERFLGRYWVNATSGSTGHPGIFLFNLPFCHRMSKKPLLSGNFPHSGTVIVDEVLERKENND